MKDLSDFKAPYHNDSALQKMADEFYQLHGNNSFPVDIEDIVEFELNLQIMPKENLYSHCDSDAYLAGDCKTIYVDYNHYFNPNNHCYVRFSLAHEIGHFVIHKDIIPIIRPQDPIEWKNIVHTFPKQEYKYIEHHAYEFAGRLLVPREELITELKLQKKNIEKAYDSIDQPFDDEIIKYTSVAICKKFNVSDQVISRRIKIENVWELVKPSN